tara:strand:- start:420 stop:1346 length:927 start_codon:yes stop_codon:yes gene_type:complete
MRIIVVGMGVQGKKRLEIAGDSVVFTVDPINKNANFYSIYDVPLESFDAALCCIPDEPKYEVVSYFLKNKKHVLVEKPLWVTNLNLIQNLQKLAIENEVQCYTAYNHRFEPHFQAMRNIIKEGELGKIYRCRLFYGNGTARLVKESAWRDCGAGVLPDLASHLLDTILFWFDVPDTKFKVISSSCFENNSPDHIIITCEESLPKFELEITLLQWKNHFTCDIFAENGSAHIDSLCKWGPASLIKRKRILPSGKPAETITTLLNADPTWKLEYDWFLNLCQSGKPADLSNDLWLAENINRLSEQAIALL